MQNLKAGLGGITHGITHGFKEACIHREDYLLYWRLKRERDAAFAAYLGHTPRGLHIGAEHYILENWFNVDLKPIKPGVYYVDATQSLPFPEHSFDFIFSEHMIEHIPFDAGLRLFRECLRVLKPSGVVRFATPNLCNVVAVLNDRDSETEAYLQWAVKEFDLPGDPFPKAPVVVNNFFRAWGHQFIYDPDVLQCALEGAGFRDVVQQQVGVSAHVPLQGLERHGLVFCDFANRFETMVFEGTAP